MAVGINKGLTATELGLSFFYKANDVFGHGNRNPQHRHRTRTSTLNSQCVMRFAFSFYKWQNTLLDVLRWTLDVGRLFFLITSCTLFSLFFIFQSYLCAESKAAEDFQTFTFYFENDAFFGTDFNYTNGVKLTWISPDLTDYRDNTTIPTWSYPIIKRLPFINEPGLQRCVSFSIGQNIYTPEDIESEEFIQDDRPYAGISYLSIGLHSKNRKKLDILEIFMGIVGPHSYADDIQKFVHELNEFKTPKGWEHQLDDEPIFGIVFERKWRLYRKTFNSKTGMDIIPNIGFGVGNPFVIAHAGGIIRLGWNLPNDFGTNIIRPGSDTNALVEKEDPRFYKRFHRLGIHCFIGTGTRVTLRDITLDGNSFSHSHSVNKKILVTNLMTGIGIIIHRFKITLAHVYETKQFKEQDEGHDYGSITMSYSF